MPLNTLLKSSTTIYYAITMEYYKIREHANILFTMGKHEL